LVGIEDRPDALDPVAYDVERQHRYGHAAQLSDESGLPANRALNELELGHLDSSIEVEARDTLRARDGLRFGSDEPAAVADGGGIGVEDADEGLDVPGFPGQLEGSDDVGLPCRGRCRDLRFADASTRRRCQLPARRLCASDDLRDLAKGIAED